MKVRSMNPVRVLFAVSMLVIAVSPAFALEPRNPMQFLGAPGPIAGAGLPILAIGYGVYWLVKRRRKANMGSR
jgi:hypothetical protein